MNVNEKIEKYKEKIREIYPQHQDQIIKSLTQRRQKCFRINELKSSKIKILKNLENEGIRFVSLNADENVYVVGLEDYEKFEQSEYHKSGQIYFQNPSSVLPVLALDPKPAQRILDLCAAPGGKTSLIASLANNQTEIVAVEKDRSRIKKLRDVTNLLDAKISRILNIDGRFLLKENPEYIDYFDKVLLDAPCSSEGLLNFYNTKPFKFWSPYKYKDYFKLQRSLIKIGVEALKPGGTLVYSTCTLSPEENEGTVNYIISKYENMQIITLPQSVQCTDLPISREGILSVKNNHGLNQKNSSPLGERGPLAVGEAEVIQGLSKYKDKIFHEDLSKTVRILPNEFYMPFYVASLRKLKSQKSKFKSTN